MWVYGFALLMLVLIPAPGWADPEVLLAIGGAASANDPQSLALSARHLEEVGLTLREGDVVPLPTCEAALRIGLRAGPEASWEQLIIVRLLKRRLSGDACEIEVQAIGSAEQTSKAASSALSRGNGKDLPCGTQLIELREGRTSGRSGSVNGRKPSDTCNDIDNGMQSPLEVYWLDSVAKGDAPPATERTRQPEHAAP